MAKDFTSLSEAELAFASGPDKFKKLILSNIKDNQDLSTETRKFLKDYVKEREALSRKDVEYIKDLMTDDIYSQEKLQSIILSILEKSVDVSEELRGTIVSKLEKQKLLLKKTGKLNFSVLEDAMSDIEKEIGDINFSKETIALESFSSRILVDFSKKLQEKFIKDFNIDSLSNEKDKEVLIELVKTPSTLTEKDIYATRKSLDDKDSIQILNNLGNALRKDKNYVERNTQDTIKEEYYSDLENMLELTSTDFTNLTTKLDGLFSQFFNKVIDESEFEKELLEEFKKNNVLTDESTEVTRQLLFLTKNANNKTKIASAEDMVVEKQKIEKSVEKKLIESPDNRKNVSNEPDYYQMAYDAAKETTEKGKDWVSDLFDFGGGDKDNKKSSKKPKGKVPKGKAGIASKAWDGAKGLFNSAKSASPNLAKKAGVVGGALDVVLGISDLIDGKEQTSLEGWDYISPMRVGMYTGYQINNGIDFLTGKERKVTPVNQSDVKPIPISTDVTKKEESQPKDQTNNANEAIKLQPNVDLSGVQPTVMGKFSTMALEFYNKTKEKIQINSAFRSFAKQKALYEANPAKAARPGRSAHERGFALDINSSTANKLDSLGLLSKFGFSRPVGGEPWHLVHASAKEVSKKPEDNSDKGLDETSLTPKKQTNTEQAVKVTDEPNLPEQFNKSANNSTTEPLVTPDISLSEQLSNEPDAKKVVNLANTTNDSSTVSSLDDKYTKVEKEEKRKQLVQATPIATPVSTSSSVTNHYTLYSDRNDVANKAISIL